MGDFINYESERIGTRRNIKQLIVPKYYRKEMLKGHSAEEIKRVKKEVKKVQSSRNMSIMFGSMFEIKEALESAGKSMKKKMQKNKCYHNKSRESISISSHI